MSERRIDIKDGRKPGWYWADNEIIDVYGAQMKPGGLAIYHAMCRHANEQGECFPSHGLLARETGMSVTTAKKYIKLLRKLELIEKEVRRYAKTGPRSNMYTLLEIPHLRQNLPKAQAESAYALGRNPAQNKTQSKENHEENSTKARDVEASLPRESTDKGRGHVDSPLSVKEKALRDFGVLGPIVTEIAKSRDMFWIRQAIMKVREPGGVVHFHQVGWVPKFIGLSDALQRATDPDPDRVRPFFDVYKRFPDPHELLEFEAGLREP